GGGGGLSPWRLEERSVAQILDYRRQSVQTGAPRYWALAVGSGALYATETKQRWAMLVYPAVDDHYTAEYRYLKDTPTLTDVDLKYPPGPDWMGAVYEAAAIAQFEMQAGRMRGEAVERYDRLLAAAIDRDQMLLTTSGPQSMASYDDGP
ncbi:unnamed protein product, partial [marine sediment metagenome]